MVKQRLCGLGDTGYVGGQENREISAFSQLNEGTSTPTWLQENWQLYAYPSGKNCYTLVPRIWAAEEKMPKSTDQGVSPTCHPSHPIVKLKGDKSHWRAWGFSLAFNPSLLIMSESKQKTNQKASYIKNTEQIGKKATWGKQILGKWKLPKLIILKGRRCCNQETRIRFHEKRKKDY